MVTRSAKLKLLLEIPSQFGSWSPPALFSQFSLLQYLCCGSLDFSSIMTPVFIHLSFYTLFKVDILKEKDSLDLQINVSVDSCQAIIIHFKNYFLTICLLHILNSSRVEVMTVGTVSQHQLLFWLIIVAKTIFVQ